MTFVVKLTAVPLVFLCLVLHALASGTMPNDETILWQRAAEAQNDFKERCRILKHHQLDVHLNATLSKLWPHVQTDLAPMTIKVISDPELEAVTYPNGVCYITTGMLAHLRNEAQLAMLLGHEMTHYVRRHALIAARRATLLGTSRRDGRDGEKTYMAPYFNAQQTSLRAAAEKEADQEGLRLIALAGFDATQVVALLSGFHGEADGFSTSGDRQAMIRPLLEKALGTIDDELSCPYDERYLSLISAALLANAQACFQKGLWDQAEHDLLKYLAVCPDDPRAHFLHGQVQQRSSSGERIKKAITAYEKAIALDQRYAPAYRELGVVHFKLGQLQTARHFFKTYLALAPQAESSDYVREYLKLCGK